jgi:dienelactone hydrolase
LFEDECAIRPTWSPSGEELVYVRLGNATRTLWARAVAGGPARRIGFADGMTYKPGFAEDGSVLFAGAPADAPRSIWRTALDGSTQPERVVSMFEPPLDPQSIVRPERVVLRSDAGAQTAVEVFDGLCADDERSNTALVWVAPPRAFTPHIWKQEIQYLAAAGVSVLSVDYHRPPGSPSTPSDSGGEPTLVEDARAVLRFSPTRPGIDPQRVFVLHVSEAAKVGYQAVAGADVQGVIDWVGIIDPRPLRDNAASWPPMLWISGSSDVVTPLRRAVAGDLTAVGAHVEQVEYAGDHIALRVEARALALDAVRRFVAAQTGGSSCSPR